MNSSAVDTMGTQTTTQCAVGYTGDKCSQCSSGYYRLNTECSPCMPPLARLFWGDGAPLLQISCYDGHGRPCVCVCVNV